MKDLWSGYAFARALKSKEAGEVVPAIWSLFADIGVPSKLHTDNGKEFRNQLMKFYAEEATKTFGSFEIAHGRPRTPTTQGAIERFNQTLHKKIAVNIFDECASRQSGRWLDVLPIAVSQYNLTVFRPTGVEPHRAFFGWMPLEFRSDETLESVEASRNATILRVCHRRLRYHLQRAKVTENKTKVKYFGVGKEVLVNSRSTETNPAAYAKEGPFSPRRKRRGRITAEREDGSFVVETDAGAEVYTQKSLFPAGESNK
jgi:hypothetical protein